MKRPLRPSGHEKRAAGGPTGEEGARSLPAARLAAAGCCRRLQYRRPEAAPRSRKEAAMLPPSRLPAVTSAAPVSPTDYECTQRSRQVQHPQGAARARALSLGRAPTARGGAQRLQEQPGGTRDVNPLLDRERTNQDSQVLRPSRTTNGRSFEPSCLGPRPRPQAHPRLQTAGESPCLPKR